MIDELLEFDLTPIEIPVKIQSIDGIVTDYVIREATGAIAGTYRDAQLACARFETKGQPASVKGLSEVEPLLVSLCLFDSENKNVLKTTVKSWPSRVQKALFEKIKKISELDEAEEDEETVKNEQESMEGGSD